MNKKLHGYLSDRIKSFVKPIVRGIFLSALFLTTGCGRDRVIVTAQPVTVSGDCAATGKSSVSENEEIAGIYVYICGAVETPGVYEVKPDCRLFEAVDMAGGLLEEADINACNLAQIVKDGEQYRIPVVGEGAEYETEGSYSADGLLDINKASAVEFAALPGIGMTKAEAIVSYREEHGRFSDTEELKNVRGIGDATYNGFRESITVR